MRDEFDDRIYQQHRAELNATISAFIRSVADVFDRLTGFLYDAPWSRNTQTKDCPDKRLTTL